MGYYSELAIEMGWPKYAPVRRPVRPAKVKAAELLGFGRFNESLHWRINERAGLPAHLRRGPRWMVIGFRYDNPGPGVPVLKRHFYTWSVADLYADRLIENDVLQLAYLKEY